MLTSTRLTAPDAAEMVRAAKTGDNVAWTRLIEQFDHKLRRTVRPYRLTAQDVDEVVQRTWVKLYEHIGTLRDESAIGGWLMTTVRREALRILQCGVREQLTDALDIERVDEHGGPEREVLERELSGALTRAVGSLPDRQRKLMTLIAGNADADYRQIGEELDMPIGSIGPIRARSLRRLQRDPQLQSLAGAA